MLCGFYIFILPRASYMTKYVSISGKWSARTPLRTITGHISLILKLGTSLDASCKEVRDAGCGCQVGGFASKGADIISSVGYHYQKLARNAAPTTEAHRAPARDNCWKYGIRHWIMMAYSYVGLPWDGGFLYCPSISGCLCFNSTARHFVCDDLSTS